MFFKVLEVLHLVVGFALGILAVFILNNHFNCAERRQQAKQNAYDDLGGPSLQVMDATYTEVSNQMAREAQHVISVLNQRSRRVAEEETRRLGRNALRDVGAVIDSTTRFFRASRVVFGENCIIKTADPNIALITGVTQSDMLESGTAWIRHLHPDDFAPMMKKWLFTLERRYPLAVKYRFRHGGTTVYSCCVTYPLYAGGACVGTRGTCWEIDKYTWELLELTESAPTSE